MSGGIDNEINYTEMGVRKSCMNKLDLTKNFKFSWSLVIMGGVIGACGVERAQMDV